MLFNKKSFMFKAISITLLLLLPLFSLSCSIKDVYADDNSSTDNKTEKGLIPFKTIKDNIKVGNVESVLTGYYGIEVKGKEYFSYYEIVPKDKEVCYRKSGSSDYWDANKYELHFLSPKTCNNLKSSYGKKIDEIIKTNKDLDFSKLEINELTEEGFIDLFVCVLGLAIPSGLAWGIYIATGCIAGIVLGTVLCIGIGVLVVYWLNQTDSYWSCEIDKLGFADGKGLLNIGDCKGGDDGASVLAMNNDKIVGTESAEWFKGNDTFDISDDCNRIIIAGGYGCWTSDDDEKTSIKNMVDDYQSINNKLCEFLKSKSDEAIKNHFIDDKDIGEIEALYDECDKCNSNESKNEIHKKIKWYILIKFCVICYANKNLINIYISDEIVAFYNEVMQYVSKDDHRSIHDKCKHFRRR